VAVTIDTLTAEQIIEQMRQRIAILYACPKFHASNAGHLNAKLFELHLLYADVTGQFDAWKQLRRQELDDPSDWQASISDAAAFVEDDAARVIAYWQAFDSHIGCDTGAAAVTLVVVARAVGAAANC